MDQSVKDGQRVVVESHNEATLDLQACLLEFLNAGDEIPVLVW